MHIIIGKLTTLQISWPKSFGQTIYALFYGSQTILSSDTVLASLTQNICFVNDDDEDDDNDDDNSNVREQIKF